MEITAVISPKMLIDGGNDIFRIKTAPIRRDKEGLTLIRPFLRERLREPLNKYTSFPKKNIKKLVNPCPTIINSLLRIPASLSIEIVATTSPI